MNLFEISCASSTPCFELKELAVRLDEDQMVYRRFCPLEPDPCIRQSEDNRRKQSDVITDAQDVLQPQLDDSIPQFC